MDALFFILMPALVLMALIYGVYRTLGRVWLEKRIRLALLEKAEAQPEQLDAFQEAGEVVAQTLNSETWQQQDYLITGVLLGLMGIACGATGLYLHAGRMAAGLYIGGYACVGLGVLVAVIGMVVGFATKRAGGQPAIDRNDV